MLKTIDQKHKPFKHQPGTIWIQRIFFLRGIFRKNTFVSIIVSKNLFQLLGQILFCLIQILPQNIYDSLLHSRILCTLSSFFGFISPNPMTYLSHIPSDINPFYTTGLFLCPLKTSENLRVIFSGGIERDQWYDIDYITLLLEILIGIL